MNDDPANISSSTRLPLVGVRLFPHERRELEAVADRDNMTLSDVLRRALSEYVVNAQKKETASAG